MSPTKAGNGEPGTAERIPDAAEKLFGYSRAELLGNNVSCLMPSPDREMHDNYLQNYLNTGEPKIIGIGRKTVAMRKDGSLFPMYLSVGHIADSGKSGFVGIIRDLTEHEHAEDEIRQLRDRLNHVARISMLGEMATGIAHEINQPLTAIATYAQASQRILKSGSGDVDELLQALEKIDEQAQRASSVITGVRKLARQGAADYQSQDAYALIHDVVALAKSYAHENRLEIDVELQAVDPAPVVRVDLIQTQQVLLNLINNAIESMQEFERQQREQGEVDGNSKAARVNVTAKINTEQQAFLAISVCDQGVGVKPELQDQIFDAFFSTKPQGIGMGLSICQSIIEAQGGEISYAPNQGHGSIFTITLPLALDRVKL